MAKAWIELARPIPWEWFATFTFDPMRTKGTYPGEEYCQSKMTHFMDCLNSSSWGSAPRRDWTFGYPGAYALGASEFTHAGLRHYHLIIGGGVGRLARFSWMEYWNQLAGLCRIYRFSQSAAEANHYCFKYVGKGGMADAYWYNLESATGLFKRNLNMLEIIRRSVSSRQGPPDPDANPGTKGD